MSPSLTERSYCPRTLKIEYWDRDDETLRRKWEHVEWIDNNTSSREQHILDTTLRYADTVLEKNLFPYSTPEGISHWTLWSIDDMNEYEIDRFVRQWIDKHQPHAVAWNYDEN